MSLLLNFITGLAWIIGGLAALATMICFLPPITEKDCSQAGSYIFAGIIPWAWLVARYLL